MPSCTHCGGAYPAARLDLGYRTCLACGERDAHSVRWLTAPINKGAYQVVSVAELKQLNPKRVGE
jgi:hypothetical protein